MKLAFTRSAATYETTSLAADAQNLSAISKIKALFGS